MNGKFELDVTHKFDPDVKEALGFLMFNPAAKELTRLALEYKKTPAEVIKIFKEIRKELIK